MQDGAEIYGWGRNTEAQVGMTASSYIEYPTLLPGGPLRAPSSLLSIASLVLLVLPVSVSAGPTEKKPGGNSLTYGNAWPATTPPTLLFCPVIQASTWAQGQPVRSRALRRTTSLLLCSAAVHLSWQAINSVFLAV